MKLHYVTHKHVSYVELPKDGAVPLGIIPMGPAEQGMRPRINKLQFGSLAYRSHCLAKGDVIVSVCGRDSKGMSKKVVRRLLHKEPLISLELEYDIQEAGFGSSGVYKYQRISVNLKKECDSFGFTVRKNGARHAVCTEYPIISNIRKGAPADKENRMRAGDRLLQIDEQNLSWLSLFEVSQILAEKEEANFLIEYRIGIVDSCMPPGTKTELEINCPDADLGIALDSSTVTSELLIEKIRNGSLAERCGAFHVGDVILSINDMDSAQLSVVEANCLIRSFRKKSGKLVIVPKMERPQLQRGIFSRSNRKVMNQQSPVSRRVYEPPRNSPESLYKVHFRKTPSPSKNPGRHSFDFQIKTISLLRNVILNISNLQEFIPFLDCGASQTFEGYSNPPHTEKGTNFIKVDPDRFAQLEAVCTQTKDSARAITMHIIKNALNVSPHCDVSCKSPNATWDNGDDGHFTTSKLLQELTENLTEIYTKKLISKESLDELLESVSMVDFDCRECYQLCSTITLRIQKVLLLLSLNDGDLDVRNVVKRLVLSIFEVNMPCEDCRTPWSSVSTVGKGISVKKDSPNKNRCSSRCRSERHPPVAVHHLSLGSSHPFSYDDKGCPNLRHLSNLTESNMSHTFNKTYPLESREAVVDLNMAERSAFYSLQRNQIESHRCNPNSDTTTVKEHDFRQENVPSDTSNETGFSDFDTSQSSDSFSEEPKVQNISTCFPEVLLKDNHCLLPGEVVSVPGNYSKYFQKKLHIDKNLLKTPKQNWKSAEVLSGTKHEFIENSSKSISKHVSVPSRFVKKCRSAMDTFKNYKARSRNHSTASEVADDCNRVGQQSSSENITVSQSSSDSENERKEKQSSTVEVKLKDEGRGFGLEIGFESSISQDNPPVPVILDIKPECAAKKIGILLVGDRVITINGQRTAGLTTVELANLLREAFASEEVLLNIDFDVVVPELRFGTFDICFDNSVKPGLEFKDFHKSSPLVVKGVVKGSSAHRSGQLFPGDEILFTNCIRQEAFDSCKSSYQRTEMVIMTVRRQPNQGQQNTELEFTQEMEENVPLEQLGSTFKVNKTSIHSLNGSSSMVLEQHVTLLRDPGLGDFGFLVGEIPATGEVHVTGIRPGGPADISKVIKKSDRVMKVNGIPVGSEGNSTLSLLLKAGDHLDLITSRLLRHKE